MFRDFEDNCKQCLVPPVHILPQALNKFIIYELNVNVHTNGHEKSVPPHSTQKYANNKVRNDK